MSTLADNNARPIAYWLLICCALVFAMVVLGGVTRLTGSGLSMVEWKPLYGILPPLSDSDWQDLFTKYQQSPEYKHVNIGMDITGFKGIFWLEYWHRILGRLIGLVFFLPLLWFWLSGKISATLLPKLVAMFVLGGLQGLLGWYMVKSGLVDNPYVSQYRLSAHLFLAIIIYGFMLWVALDLLLPKRPLTEPKPPLRYLKKLSIGLLGLASLTILSGGFVAGLKAGMSYNTFPLMAGQWVPDGIMNLQPWYRNLFENVATVQFDHRILALLTLLFTSLLWWYSRRFTLPSTVKFACNGALVVVVIQVGLGISTLLLQVPIVLASAHQAGALVLFTMILLLAQQLHRRTTKRALDSVSSESSFKSIPSS